MRLYLIRLAAVSTALLILTSLPLPLSRIQIAQAQDETRTIEELRLILRAGSDEEKHRAVSELSSITSEKASDLLLKTLKNNLAERRGYYVKYGSTSGALATFWTVVSSENEMLVRALGERKYHKALPTLRKMLPMNEKWLGFSKEALAAAIFLISPQPVKYSVDGELRIYPEPDLPDATSITGSLRLPVAGEAAWEKSGLNSRLRELVRVLGSDGGPAGFRDPYYRTLKEDIGVTTLVSLAKDGDPLVRPYAVEALGILGENSNEIIPVLTAAVRDNDPRVRFRSVSAFTHIPISTDKPAEAVRIISALRDALTDAEPEVRYNATHSFATHATGNRSMNEWIDDVVPLLVSALSDKVGYVRGGAALALGRIGPRTDEVVPGLARLLTSPESSDRESAAHALSDLHNSNSYTPEERRERIEREIGRALLTVATDPSNDVRYAVADGLREIGSVLPGVIPALIKLTKDPSRGVRAQAARSLGTFEVQGTRIVPALAMMLGVQDEDTEVIESVLKALGEIGWEARSAASKVRKLLQSGTPRIREYAGYALEKMERRPTREEKRAWNLYNAVDLPAPFSRRQLARHYCQQKVVRCLILGPLSW